MAKPVKETTVKIAERSVEPSMAKVYKGNEFVTADQQRAYAECMDRMKQHLVIGKLMNSPEWNKITAISTFLMLELEEKRNGKGRGED